MKRNSMTGSPRRTRCGAPDSPGETGRSDPTVGARDLKRHGNVVQLCLDTGPARGQQPAQAQDCDPPGNRARSYITFSGRRSAGHGCLERLDDSGRRRSVLPRGGEFRAGGGSALRRHALLCRQRERDAVGPAEAVLGRVLAAARPAGSGRRRRTSRSSSRRRR